MNIQISKILNVYKPIGITSYDVVRKVKKTLDFKKVGHGGTLDPFADGVLIILIGRGATKRMNEILSTSKSYEAILELGQKTDTGDHTGTVSQTSDIKEINIDQIKKVVEKFTGEISQVPPQYSAKKVNGQPAYKIARKGLEVKLKPTNITIYDLHIDLLGTDKIKITVTCSSGTYIRVLGEEIAETLGMVGHLSSLTRTRIGDYNIEDSVKLENLESALSQEIELLHHQNEEFAENIE